MPLISEACHQQLTEHILPFWLALKDETYGGFYGYVGYDLAVDRTYEKGCILNSRILWFFSEAALLLGNAKAKAAAYFIFFFYLIYKFYSHNFIIIVYKIKKYNHGNELFIFRLFPAMFFSASANNSKIFVIHLKLF